MNKQEMAGTHRPYCEVGSAYNTFARKPDPKRHLAKSRLRWEDNIKIGLKGIECEAVHLIHLDLRVQKMQ
jgi:hypothetical protein